MQILLVTPQIHQGIPHPLAGAVIGDFTPPLNAVQRVGWIAGVKAEMLKASPLTEGIDGGMAEE